jgi:hypothetical protein
MLPKFVVTEQNIFRAVVSCAAKDARRLSELSVREEPDNLLRMKTETYRDPVVEAYMRDVDRTLLRENLKLTPAQRLDKLVNFSEFAAELRAAGERARRSRKS